MKEMVLVGIDVSKKTLDLFILPYGERMTIINDLKGYRLWWGKMLKLCSADTPVLVVMEHTGYYSAKFEDFLRKMSVGYCKIPATQIKKSIGMVRGKSDKIDAERIAGYGWLRRDTLRPDEPVSKAVEELKAWLSLRMKLVRERAGYLSRVKEMKSAGCTIGMDQQKKIITCLDQQIKKTDADIKAHIRANEELQKTHDLLMSVKGVGTVVAAYMICSTHNFTKFNDARKFNCYAGIAPFSHQSGTSIKGKARVSHLANKDIKTLLNLAAFCAVRCDEELKTYYQRKVEEGKAKMSCMNAVRAKIVARMFAVVKRETPFIPLRTAA
jgi:transposase